MKISLHSSNMRCKPVAWALTLIEMTIVLLLILALVGGGIYFTNAYSEWEAAKRAGESLRTVYSAQRQYLSDNPLKKPSDITAELLLPYLNGATSLPVIRDVNDEVLDIDLTVSPPLLKKGEDTYDISGKNDDGQWDVGQL